MKTLSIILSIVTFSLAGASAKEKPTVKPVSIVGSWKVKDSGVIWTFTAENRVTISSGLTASWKPAGDDASKYEVKGTTGAVYTAVVDPLGKAVQLANAEGKTLDAERIPDKAPEAAAVDPIVGRWRHSGKVMWTFTADGKMVSSTRGVRGTWKLTKGSAFERQYEILWNGGAVAVSCEMDSDHRKMKCEDSRGRACAPERIDDAKGE